MKKSLKQLTVKVTEEKEQQLRKYANKYHNGNVAMAIREFIDKGLSINSYQDEINFIREMINEEIESTINPYMNRLIAITSKGSIMSASSHFALGEVLSRLVEPKYRKDLEEVLIENKKKGYSYVISKDENLK